jgi:biofilm PGA synthesis N-glycosyltransferase PgaC
MLVIFLAAAAVLWSSVFGYVAVLLVLTAYARANRSHPTESQSSPQLPAIAVVVPVRNEEHFLASKLADLRRSDYPAERLEIIIVDGGSSDATVSLAEAELARGATFRLVPMRDATGKADQLNAILPTLPHKFIVVTDADAVLDPSCMRILVETLRDDPATAIVGARVRPATRMLEERIHWWLLNSLWWLEGEALGNAQVSGVCYALRSSAVEKLPVDCTAEDIHFGLVASSRGQRVRLSRRAVATELRVPQTMRDFTKFRHRRGAGYIHELRRTRPAFAPLRWHIMQAVRLFHFFVMPVLAAALAVAGLVLLATPHWRWALAAAAAFAMPAAAALFASTTLGEGRRWRLGLAAGRLTGLTWFSLLALPRASTPKLVKGE